MSYECSQCGYAFEPFADEAVGPFCDCPRCGGLAVEQQGRAAPAKAAAPAADPFAEPEDIIDPFGGKTGALPLSPSLFGTYFTEAAGTAPPPPAAGRGSPFDRVDDGPLSTGDIHREPTLLMPDDAPAPAPARAGAPRVAPREVTIPGLSDQKIRSAAGDLLDPRSRADRRDIHDELTSLADEAQRPRPAARRAVVDAVAHEQSGRGGLPLEPAAQPQVEFGRPAEEPATFNMRIGEDGAYREVSDPAARAPRADIDIFGSDERADDDESTVVSPEPEPGTFDVDIDEGEQPEPEPDPELEQAAEALFPEDDEALAASAPPDGAFADEDAPSGDALPEDDDGAAFAGAYPDDEDDAPLSWTESALPATDAEMDALASVEDDEAALDLDDAFIQQLPRPPGMPDAQAAGMPEGSSPFASLLSGDMLVSADHERPPEILVSSARTASGEMLISGDHALPAEDGEVLEDDAELSEVSDRFRATGAAAAEGDWVVSVPRAAPPPPRKGKARPAKAVDEVAGLQLPALEMPEDHAADRPPPPKTELKLKAARKPKGSAEAAAAKVVDDTPKAPRFFSGTLFFIVLLVALAMGAAGVGAGFALVSAQKKAAPLTGPAKARQLLGDAHRLLHEDKPREALELLKRAATDDPTLAEIQRAMGTAHAKLGNEEEAARAYSYYVRLAPNAPDAEAIRLMLARHRGEEP